MLKDESMTCNERLVDTADQASRDAETHLAAAIAAASKVVQRYKPTGYCHYCQGEVGKDQIFCDEFCEEDKRREEWAKQQRPI